LQVQSYVLKATSKFQDLINRFDNSTHREIDSSIMKLANDPYSNTKPLKGRYYGRRSLRIGKIRVIFAICEECRKLGALLRKDSKCVDCDEESDKTVKLFYVGFRETVYDSL